MSEEKEDLLASRPEHVPVLMYFIDDEGMRCSNCGHRPNLGERVAFHCWEVGQVGMRCPKCGVWGRIDYDIEATGDLMQAGKGRVEIIAPGPSKRNLQ